MKSFLFIMMLLVPLTTPRADADEIRLRSTVRIEVGEPLTLGTIARLEGPEAEALADIVIADEVDSDGWRVFTSDEIRARLDSTDIHWGHLDLRGGDVNVRTMHPRLVVDETAPEPELDLPILQRLRNEVARVLVANAEDVRLTYDARDLDGLRSLTILEGDHVFIDPGPPSGRMTIDILVTREARIAFEHEVRAAARVKRTVCTTRRQIDRGEQITMDDVVAEPLWLRPDEQAATPAELVNATTRTRIELGRRVLRSELEPAVTIRKGSSIEVLQVDRSLTVRFKAIALENGRTGEMIRVRREGTRGASPVRGRVEGPGRVTVFAGEASPMANDEGGAS